MKRCVISTCQSREDGSNFMIPFKRKWRRFVPPGVIALKLKNPKICCLHFESKYKNEENGEIQKDAIPKIFKYKKPKVKCIELADTCRFCLAKLNRDNTDLDVELMEQFRDLTQIPLKTSFLYSRKVCSTCKENVNFAFKLKNYLVKKQLSLICTLGALEENEEVQHKMETRGTIKDVEIKEEFEDPETFQLPFPENLEIKEEINVSDPEDLQDPEYIYCKNLNDPEMYKFSVERRNSEELEDLEQREEEEKPENLEIPQQKGRFDNNDYKATYVKQIIICTFCGMSIQRGSIKRHVLRKHTEITKEEQKYSCDQCNFRTIFKELIRSHVHRHLVERKFDCPECVGKSFKTKAAVKWHIKAIHEKRKKVTLVRCELCGLVLRSKATYKEHVNVKHLKEELYECKEPGCEEKFINRKPYIQHKAKHQGIRFPCTECDRVFYTKGKINQHMKSHTRPEKCEQCGLGFATISSLSIHVRKNHENEKNCECQYCNKCFFGITRLNRHLIESHMNVKIKCEVPGCKSQFARKETYRNHVKSHHQDLGAEKFQELLSNIQNIKIEFDETQVVK